VGRSEILHLANTQRLFNASRSLQFFMFTITKSSFRRWGSQIAIYDIEQQCLGVLSAKFQKEIKQDNRRFPISTFYLKNIILLR